MSLTLISEWASFGGVLSVHDHHSSVTNCTMRFAVYTPPQAAFEPVPVLWYLSGLTCTWANVMEKSGIQNYAAQHGMMIIAPDTSPRGDAIADADTYDLGQGAGFYLTATEAPWAPHYRMDEYITVDLQWLISEHFPKADLSRQGVTGHSMGGHGAMTLHLKNPDVFKSCSAFAPIVSPMQVPWGQKALSAYLGEDTSQWAAFDSTQLVQSKASSADILIDQGDADQFLPEQLDATAFLEAAAQAGQKVTYRSQPGYDHSYYFVASFIGEHVAHHAEALSTA